MVCTTLWCVYVQYYVYDIVCMSSQKFNLDRTCLFISTSVITISFTFCSYDSILLFCKQTYTNWLNTNTHNNDNTLMNKWPGPYQNMMQPCQTPAPGATCSTTRGSTVATVTATTTITITCTTRTVAVTVALPQGWSAFSPCEVDPSSLPGNLHVSTVYSSREIYSVVIIIIKICC